MNLEDILTAHPHPKAAYWQLGNLLINDIKEGSVVLIFCSDFRGGKGDAEKPNYSKVRNILYGLSRLDWDLFLYDAGDLISGKSTADTRHTDVYFSPLHIRPKTAHSYNDRFL